MHDIANLLRDRLATIAKGDFSLSAAEASWATSPLPIDPWMSWTLLSLIQHRQRQQFVLDTMRFKLSGDAETLAAAGALGHPNVPQQGVVPGDADWEYYFHGIGCCLTHRNSGVSIDVDFHDETADWISFWFYRGFLCSLSSPAPIEKRLLELHPTIETVELSIARLLKLNLLEARNDAGSTFRLNFSWEDPDMLLGDLEDDWEANETQVAIGLGDWPKLIELGHLNFEAQSKACFHEQIARLKTDYQNTKTASNALAALNDMIPDQIETLVIDSLASENLSVVSSSLQICLLYTSPSPRDLSTSRMPSSA